MIAFEQHRPAGRLTRCIAAAVSIWLCGCAGSGPPPTDTSDWFATIQRTIFDQHCLSAGCHNSQARAGGMDLSAGASYASLVNVPPENPAALSAGMLRVAPTDPAVSFLLAKITAPGPGQGSRMPQGSDPLAQSDIDSIEQWIMAGAPRTGTRGPTPTATAIGPARTATATGTESATDTPSATATATPIPPDTATATATVTGTPPATSTASTTATTSQTPTASPSPSPTATLGQFGQVQQIFNTTCTGAFCHDQQGMSGNLVLVEGQSYDQLVGVMPDNGAARAAGLLRVDPGAPDNSFIIVKLEGPPLPMGSRMPLSEPPLSADEMQLIRSWIAGGAPR